MSSIIIIKKSGAAESGESIAEKNHIKKDREHNYIYPEDSFYHGRIISSVNDKLGYVCAAMNTVARRSFEKRRKNKAAKLLGRIDNLERRVVNYVPYCTGIHRYSNWRWKRLSEKQRRFYPRLDYGYIDEDDAFLIMSFLRDEKVNEFDFVTDTRYVVVIDEPEGMWEGMKKSGLVKIDEIVTECS